MKNLLLLAMALFLLLYITIDPWRDGQGGGRQQWSGGHKQYRGYDWGAHQHHLNQDESRVGKTVHTPGFFIK